MRRPPRSTLLPHTTPFRPPGTQDAWQAQVYEGGRGRGAGGGGEGRAQAQAQARPSRTGQGREEHKLIGRPRPVHLAAVGAAARIDLHDVSKSFRAVVGGRRGTLHQSRNPRRQSLPDFPNPAYHLC